MYLKYLTSILICFSITFLTLAQCPNTNITLSTQADVDNFLTTYPTCTMIPVGVDIIINDNFSGDITNLNGLSGLTSIAGNLTIQFNTALTNIDGLSNLISVGGDLSIDYNSALTDIDGLSNLTSV